MIVHLCVWWLYEFTVSVASINTMGTRTCVSYHHYIGVIMTTTASQITSRRVVYSIVYSDQRKHQSSASLAFERGIHRDRWIPRTKGQLRGKCFHLMTSSWYRYGPGCRQWLYNCYHISSTILNNIYTPRFNEVERGVYWYHLVRLSVCGQNRVRSVSSTILIGSISYLHILSSNFRRYVACNASFKIQNFWRIL